MNNRDNSSSQKVFEVIGVDEYSPLPENGVKVVGITAENASSLPPKAVVSVTGVKRTVHSRENNQPHDSTPERPPSPKYSLPTEEDLDDSFWEQRKTWLASFKTTSYSAGNHPSTNTMPNIFVSGVGQGVIVREGGKIGPVHVAASAFSDGRQTTYQDIPGAKVVGVDPRVRVESGGSIGPVYVNGKCVKEDALILAVNADQPIDEIKTLINVYISQGKDINQIIDSRYKGNILHLAAHKESKVLVDFILEKAQKNELPNILNSQTGKNGATALHIAAFEGNEEIARALLEAGADKTVLDNKNRNAVDVAKAFGNENLANFISHFEKPNPYIRPSATF